MPDDHLYYVGYPEEPDGSRWIKIGRANNVARRIAELRIGTPKALEVLGIEVGRGAQERVVHRLFKSLRGNGEWFLFSREACESLCERIRAEFPQWPDLLVDHRETARIQTNAKAAAKCRERAEHEKARCELERLQRERESLEAQLLREQKRASMDEFRKYRRECRREYRRKPKPTEKPVEPDVVAQIQQQLAAKHKPPAIPKSEDAKPMTPKSVLDPKWTLRGVLALLPETDPDDPEGER